MSLERDSILQNSSSDNSNLQIQKARFYSDKIVISSRAEYCKHKEKIHENSLKNLKDNKVKGELSAKSIKHIKKHLQAWSESIRVYNNTHNNSLYSNERKLIFVTLTLSDDQVQDDKWIKRYMFQKFIEDIKRSDNVENYFIRYEAQGNGRIHAHLILDKYIDKEKITWLWNKIQGRFGYLDHFTRKHGHDNPPSTQVQILGSTEAASRYLLNYSTKKEKNRKIEGRLYGMSDSLKNLDVFESSISKNVNFVLKKIIEENSKNVIADDYFTIITLSRLDYERYFTAELKCDYRAYYNDLYNYLYNSHLHPYEKERKKHQAERSGKENSQVAEHHNTDSADFEKFIQTVIDFS